MKKGNVNNKYTPVTLLFKNFYNYWLVGFNFNTPEQISIINPIVRIIKKIIATENPYNPDWYKETEIGKIKTISRSNTKNRIPTA